jgi:hypothetical protein
MLRLHAAPQELAQSGDRIPRPDRIFIDQRPDAVQRIENEMRIDVRLDRFELQLFDRSVSNSWARDLTM